MPPGLCPGSADVSVSAGRAQSDKQVPGHRAARGPVPLHPAPDGSQTTTSPKRVFLLVSGMLTSVCYNARTTLNQWKWRSHFVSVLLTEYNVPQDGCSSHENELSDCTALFERVHYIKWRIPG